jgi:hypothetical protein
MKFPPHFTLEELTSSQTATRNEIDNEPNEQEKSNILRVAWFLESLRMRVRMKTGKRSVIIVSSGFRCEMLNIMIGGSKTSAHMQGLAADIMCPDLTPLELAKFIRDNMDDEPFDQVIHEFNRWVHIGLSKALPRYEELTAVKENGKTVYKKGLI